jgi:hypothetical protein
MRLRDGTHRPDTLRYAEGRRTPVGGRLFLILLACALLKPVPGRADLAIEGRLITHSGHVVDTLSTHLSIQGALIRRSLEGRGTLADFLGRRVEIQNRTTSSSMVLDLDAGTYTRSAGEVPLCHPWNLLDLRWLGRVPEGKSARLVWPDTSATILGQRAQPFDFCFSTRQKGGSTIRFWVAYQLDSLFGPENPVALYCGAPEAEADARLCSQLARQFGLSAESIEALHQVRLGFPVRIESFMGQGDYRLDLACFETLSVQRVDLPDSLFAAPSALQPADGSGQK